MSEPLSGTDPVPVEEWGDDHVPALGAVLGFIFVLAIGTWAWAEEPLPEPMTETPPTVSFSPEGNTSLLDPGGSLAPPAPPVPDQVPVADEGVLREPEAPVAEAPLPEQSVAEAPAVKPKKRYPIHQLHRPNVGLGLNVGPLQSLPGATFSGTTLRAIQLLVEYQPAVIQAIGVLGVGLNFAVFPDFSPVPTAELAGLTEEEKSAYRTKHTLGVLSAGAQARYQFRYWRNQWVVPYAAVELNFMHASSGNGLLLSPSFGGMLLLNIFSPKEAAEAFASTGISRSYLLAEARLPSAVMGSFAISGVSVFFGLRTEL